MASTRWRWLLVVGDQGFRADADGVQFVEPQMVERAMQGVDGVEMRNVGRGHPLFGPACSLIRSEALIRIDSERPLPYGLLALASGPPSRSMAATVPNYCCSLAAAWRL